METGVVTKSTGSWYIVRKENGEQVECRMRGKLRLKGSRTTNPVAVGDRVDMEYDREEYVITRIHERRNYIIRRSTNLSKEAHIIATNVDQALLVATINHPQTPTVFIDRFLMTVEAYNIPAVIVFNKTDLYNESDLARMQELIAIYTSVGYPCHALSAEEPESLVPFKALLANKTTVLSGMSGVGKSTLINRIEPSLQLKVGAISDSHDTGKHTTTFAEIFSLGENSYIIDTPGLRSFGIIDIAKEEISHFFPELFNVSDNCRFYNCTHTHEPGCAVIEAVQKGDISESRYWSYLSMMEENGEKYR
ncbi:ribosome small subunit-dependent GTPase A [Odoribacter lunatus]|uniref:ribosome small subunit-dependent GTPase A n=1 Tax=Odoribacter lunatus TaxID=2941335 RepID=UPI00203DE3BC|nr:ribosome small subunit-dependent GTPase A [Odoribacter lunatus]